MFSVTNDKQVEGRGTFGLNPKALKFFLKALKIASGDSNEVAILEVGAGLALAAGVIFAVYKVRKRLGVKNCLRCNNIANSKCSKCNALICIDCSVNGCPNCGSMKFVRL